MILLIGGASHTGKTLFAQRLLETYRWPYLSLDHLKMGLIRSGNTELTPMDDCELTQLLWPIAPALLGVLVIRFKFFKGKFTKGLDKSFLRVYDLNAVSVS